MNDLHLLGVQDRLNRRVFLRHASTSLGAAALASLLGPSARAEPAGALTHPARAKRIIYLFQSGAPSQMDLFDPKPQMQSRRGQNLPDSVRQGQCLTTMTSGQSRFPVAPSLFRFARHGQCGLWLSELLPHLAGVAD